MDTKISWTYFIKKIDLIRVGESVSRGKAFNALGRTPKIFCIVENEGVGREKNAFWKYKKWK